MRRVAQQRDMATTTGSMTMVTGGMMTGELPNVIAHLLDKTLS